MRLADKTQTYRMRETLPAYLYRDPMLVLEQKQENELKRSCAGCVHVYRVEIGGSVENGCNVGKVFGKRCNLYRETKE